MELYFEKLSKNYGEKHAIRQVSMTLSEGIYGLLGPNGAGKSTLMNILTGNLPQSSGRILLNGEDIRNLGTAFRRRVGYMPQQQAFYPTFTAEHFLYYIASLRGMERRKATERIDWALGLLNLEDVRYKTIKSLSGGMKQRLLLAQSILDDPDILVLDEPTAGLDPKQRIAVRNLVSEIALHKIVILSTHVVTDVDYISKELILLSDGHVLRQGTAQQLTQELEGQVWELQVEERQISDLSHYGLVCGMMKNKSGILVRMLAAEQPPFPGQTTQPGLEDVYLYYFGDIDGL